MTEEARDRPTLRAMTRVHRHLESQNGARKRKVSERKTWAQRLLPNFGWLALILAFAGLSPSALAHPGAGIAVDRAGQVYFLDTGSGLWRIDTRGKVSRLSEQWFHWLAVDENNRFADVRLPSGALGDVVKASTNPTVLLSSDYPIATDDDGSLYYPSAAAGGLRIMRMAPSGATSAIAALPATVKGEPLSHINGITAGPHGSLYYSEDSAIRRIDAQGRVSTVVTISAPDDPPSIPATDQHPYLRGLAVDIRGEIYVADTGDARVLKITPEGKVTTLLRTQSPWSPTAVALYRGDVYILEYLHTGIEVRRDWLPRVRKITSNGQSSIVATVDQMPGAR